MGMLKIGCIQHLVVKPEGKKNSLEELQVYRTNIRTCLTETERKNWTHFRIHSSGGLELSAPVPRLLAIS